MDAIGGWQRVIGILGGLGPHAHIEFERLLLDHAGRGLGRPAVDQDYPPWILASVTDAPDRTRAIVAAEPSPVDRMVLGLRRLESRPGVPGADFAAIPCNAAHAFLPALRERISLPLLDMIGETVDEVVRIAGPAPVVGLLATDGTLAAGVYRDAVARRAPGLRWVTPLDLPDGAALQERLVMEPITGPMRSGRRAGGGIKSGGLADPEVGPGLRRRLAEAVERLAAAGATSVVLACTEIPLAIGREALAGTPLVDPMDVAARATLAIARGDRDLP